MDPTIISLAVTGWFVSTWLAYRWGLRSQRETAKREAKISALSAIDQVRQEILASNYLPDLIVPSRRQLKGPIFKFSARLSRDQRVRIESAWQAYQRIGEDDVHPDNFESDRTWLDEAKVLLLDPLAKLRNEIAETSLYCAKPKSLRDHPIST